MCKFLRSVIEALLLAMTIKQTGQLERPQGADKCMLFQMLKKKIKFYDWEACGLTQIGCNSRGRVSNGLLKFTSARKI